jgi:hypothetical protein
MAVEVDRREYVRHKPLRIYSIDPDLVLSLLRIHDGTLEDGALAGATVKDGRLLLKVWGDGWPGVPEAGVIPTVEIGGKS